MWMPVDQYIFTFGLIFVHWHVKKMTCPFFKLPTNYYELLDELEKIDETNLSRVEVRSSLSAKTASRVSEGILEKASSVGAKMVKGPSP